MSARHVVVVGGSSGIGAAIVRGFAALDGYRVIATGLPAGSVAPAEDVAMAAAAVDVRPLDVRDPAAVDAFFGALERLDVLVNCAGVILRDGVEFDEEGFTTVIDVNLAGTMRCARAARPLLGSSRGCIVNTASMMSFFGSGTAPAYAASKGGVGQLTRSLAIAWAADGIRVNAIAPGWIRTALTAPLEDNEARSSAILARTPMNRWGQPDDVVGPVLFLASDAAAFVTGAVLCVDGGYSAG